MTKPAALKALCWKLLCYLNELSGQQAHFDRLSDLHVMRLIRPSFQPSLRPGDEDIAIWAKYKKRYRNAVGRENRNPDSRTFSLFLI